VLNFVPAGKCMADGLLETTMYLPKREAADFK